MPAVRVERTSRPHPTGALLALLVACGGGGTPPGDDTDAPSGTDTGDSAPATAPAPLLEEGRYQGTITSIEDDDCGTITDDLFLTGFQLTWTSDTTFQLAEVSDAYVVECTVGEPITCTGYAAEVQVGMGSLLKLEATYEWLDVVTTTNFLVIEHVAVDCEGNGCANYATNAGTTFPCAFRVNESWSR